MPCECNTRPDHGSPSTSCATLDKSPNSTISSFFICKVDSQIVIPRRAVERSKCIYIVKGQNHALHLVTLCNSIISFYWLYCIFLFLHSSLGFPGGATGKEPTCQCRRHKRRGFDPWVWKIPWRRAWQPTPVFLPAESHGQRSLAGSQGHKESYMTEVTQHSTLLYFLFCFTLIMGKKLQFLDVQAYLRDIMGLVPDYCNKTNITIN